ncbi:MAG: replication initiation negative regulator SeqA [Lonepinella koalarum]|nr:replication initiation negative regulator SeqA [Lonepinella koalarum]
MKIIEVDEELYQYIAGQTQSIGESASDILRRLLNLPLSTISHSPLNFSEIQSEAETNFTHSSQHKPESAVEITAVLKEQIKTGSVSVQTQEMGQTQIAFTGSDTVAIALQDLLNSDNFQQETKAVNRFLGILSQLYVADMQAFAQAIDSQSVQGRTRTYFAKDEQTLLVCGNHTKPKQIPNSPYWVITNNNSGRKMIMLEGIMRGMQLSESLINEVQDAFVGG